MTKDDPYNNESHLHQPLLSPIPSAPSSSDINDTTRTIVTAVLVEEDEPTIIHSNSSSNNNNRVVRGRWKDGLCSCCRYGCCHPSNIMSYFCPTIAIAQVMRRFNLLISGRVGTVETSKKQFRFIVILTFLYLLFYQWKSTFFMLDHHHDKQSIPATTNNVLILTILVLVPTLFGLFTLWLVVRTRMHIRRLHTIPDSNCCCGCCPCGVCEDVIVSYCCTSCVISQMARHTADYDTYCGRYCSDTGLPCSNAIRTSIV